MTRKTRRNHPHIGLTKISLSNLNTGEKNFLALYAATPITLYKDGRLKIKTSEGLFMDLDRNQPFDNWTARIRDLANAYLEFDHGR